MAKIDTLFITKTTENHTQFGAAHTYIARIREYSPLRKGGVQQQAVPPKFSGMPVN